MLLIYEQFIYQSNSVLKVQYIIESIILFEVYDQKNLSFVISPNKQ